MASVTSASRLLSRNRNTSSFERSGPTQVGSSAVTPRLGSDLIAVGPFAPGEPTRAGQPAPAQPRGYVAFFNRDGEVVSRTPVGGSVWAPTMTPDGTRTVAGLDDEKLYVFNGPTLVASGVPVGGDTDLRGVALTDDGH